MFLDTSMYLCCQIYLYEFRYNHSTFVDWLCDQSIKNIAPNEEIKNNFKKVVDMISSIGIKSANTKLVMYNNIIEDFAIEKEND